MRVIAVPIERVRRLVEIVAWQVPRRVRNVVELVPEDALHARRSGNYVRDDAQPKGRFSRRPVFAGAWGR